MAIKKTFAKMYRLTRSSCYEDVDEITVTKKSP